MQSLPDFVAGAPASQAFQLAVGLADNLLDVTDNASLAALFALDSHLTGKVGLLDVHNVRSKSAQERCALLLAHKDTLDEANDAPAPSSDSSGGHPHLLGKRRRPAVHLRARPLPAVAVGDWLPRHRSRPHLS